MSATHEEVVVVAGTSDPDVHDSMSELRVSWSPTGTPRCTSNSTVKRCPTHILCRVPSSGNLGLEGAYYME